MLFASPEFGYISLGWQFKNHPVSSLKKCIFRTSGEGVEETLIVQFGQQWMKSTTDALQDKKEEDDDPSQVTGVQIKIHRFQVNFDSECF